MKVNGKEKRQGHHEVMDLKMSVAHLLTASQFVKTSFFFLDINELNK